MNFECSFKVLNSTFLLIVLLPFMGHTQIKSESILVSNDTEQHQSKDSSLFVDYHILGEWVNDTIQDGKRVTAGQIHWKFEEGGKFQHLRFYQDGVYEIQDKHLTIRTNKTVVYEIVKLESNVLEVRQINPDFGVVSPRFTLVRIFRSSDE